MNSASNVQLTFFFYYLLSASAPGMYELIDGKKIYMYPIYMHLHTAMYVDPYVYAGIYLLNSCTCLIYFPLPANMGSILLGKKCLSFW